VERRPTLARAWAVAYCTWSPTSSARPRHVGHCPGGANIVAMRWQRGAGLEFDRVAAFNDAVFAIALTLLVLDLHLPHLHDPRSSSDFVHALGNIVPDLISFAIAFSVIGQNWIRQHRFYGDLSAVDSRFLALNVVYLACIALVPFPTSVISQYVDNPMAFTMFAVVLAAVSATDALLIAYAQAAGLVRKAWTPPEYRFALQETLAPIVLFLGTIPLAFLIDPIPTIVLWLPFSFLLRRLLERRR
jgi:TMEM175 potassium channel family protein